ncbi:ComEA family DNA-binding protein [Parapedobacter sp.]
MGLVLLALWGVSHMGSLGRDAPAWDIADQIATVDSFLATTRQQQSPARWNSGRPTNKKEMPTPQPTYFRFDPNGLSAEDWKRLGLSNRQIQMIKNYEAKGGRFRKKEDLAKIYAIDDADYDRLAPYIDIKQVERVEPTPKRINANGSGAEATRGVTPRVLPIDLNHADSLELQYLPGIGPVFASRIVRFRDLLGGFHHVSQLLDVYGFDSVRFGGLEQYVYVDTTKVEKIPLNTAPYERFRDHPFISHKLANAIVQYRKQHGPYRAMSDLLGIAIMDEQIFLKIAPYLTLADD